MYKSLLNKKHKRTLAPTTNYNLALKGLSRITAAD